MTSHLHYAMKETCKIFHTFLPQSRGQISEGGASDTATGIRKKLDIPAFDTTIVYPTDQTGQLTRANDISVYNIMKEAALANNKKFRSETLTIVKSIGDHISQFVYSQLQDVLLSKDPVACFQAFVDLGGQPNISLGHNGKTRLTKKEFPRIGPSSV